MQNACDAGIGLRGGAPGACRAQMMRTLKLHRHFWPLVAIFKRLRRDRLGPRRPSDSWLQHDANAHAMSSGEVPLVLMRQAGPSSPIWMRLSLAKRYGGISRLLGAGLFLNTRPAPSKVDPWQGQK